MLEKPLYGRACNGCGWCCIAEQCPISVMIFGPKPLCPALEQHGERYACGLIVSADRYAKDEEAAHLALKAGVLLGVGTGCDAIVTPEDRIESNRIDQEKAA